MSEVLSLMKIAFTAIGIILLPGYSLVFALFPRHTDLEPAEFLGLAGALGLMVNTLIGIILIQTGIGITLLYQMAILIIVVIVCLIRLLTRRASQEPGNQPATSSGFSVSKVFSTTVGMLVLATPLILFPTIFRQTAPQEHFTEFYALPINQVSTGAASSITLGAINREDTETEYSIYLVVDGVKAVNPLSTFTLNNDEKWESDVNLATLPSPPKEQIKLELYRSGSTTPYRTLSLQINEL